MTKRLILKEKKTGNHSHDRVIPAESTATAERWGIIFDEHRFSFLFFSFFFEFLFVCCCCFFLERHFPRSIFTSGAPMRMSRIFPLFFCYCCCSIFFCVGWRLRINHDADYCNVLYFFLSFSSPLSDRFRSPVYYE